MKTYKLEIIKKNTKEVVKTWIIQVNLKWKKIEDFKNSFMLWYYIYGMEVSEASNFFYSILSWEEQIENYIKDLKKEYFTKVEKQLKKEIEEKEVEVFINLLEDFTNFLTQKKWENIQKKN